MQYSVLHLRHLARTLGFALGVSSVAGCSFDEATEVAPPNTCTLPTDCASDLSCQAGVCVLPSTDAQLDVLLEVTPKRMPDGSQPFPILYGPFSLQGGRRNFELPTPIAIAGRVHKGPEVINAQLTFTPTKPIPALAKPTLARSGLNAVRSDFTVQLLRGVEYRVSVQPTDTTFPPYTRVFTADEGFELDVDYEQLDTSTVTFVIRGAPNGQSVRARAKNSDQIISNTQRLETGRATLTFASAMPPPYQIEIATEQSGSNQVSTLAGRCDSTRALIPTFTVDESAFKREPRAQGAFDLAVDLPVMPEPVPYEGRIELCTQRKGLAGLPVSLRSTALALMNMPQGISAAFSVAADVQTDGEPTQTFCTRVIPGDYVVLVTPPAAVNCEIFAERRKIVEASTEPDTLVLRTPAKLNGKILDREMLPVANATIDAIALGIDTTMMLAEDDPTVPLYNRSRQTSSDRNGTFELNVDVGMYDLIVKPPMQSGFAWQIKPGVNVGSARLESFSTRVELNAPALVEGSLRYADGANQRSLAGAEIRAYTVEDEKTPNARGVEIGHTQADDDGNVTLFISPEPQTAW